MEKSIIGILGDDSSTLEETINSLSINGKPILRFSSPAELVRAINNNEPIEAIILISEHIVSDTPGFIKHIRKILDWQGILMLVTNAHHEQLIISCFLSGADDVISPPHTALELSARLYSIRRRCAPLPGPVIEKHPSQEPVITTFSKYRIDKKNHAIYLSGNLVKLTEKEYLLAALFFENMGKTLSRDILLPIIWGIGSHVATRTLDTHVSRLRKKLHLYGKYGYELRSVYQHGYRLQTTASQFSSSEIELAPAEVDQVNTSKKTKYTHVHTNPNDYG